MNFIEEEISRLKASDLFRELKIVENSNGKNILINSHSYLSFSSNDYLGLSQSYEIRETAINTLKEFGLMIPSSRLLSGTTKYHRILEEELAKFMDEEDAIVFNTGYMTNIGVLSALSEKEKTVFFIDALCHSSIIEGAKLARVTICVYPHHDLKNLQDMLEQAIDFKRKFIITEGVFSMDGDIAPLKELVELKKKYNAHLIVDDAHGFGVLGMNGRGTYEIFDVLKEIEIKMFTLSKSAACFGGVIVASKSLIQFLLNKARTFIFTTALPAVICACAIKSVELIKNSSENRKVLLENANYLREKLRSTGFDSRNSQTQIIPILLKETKKAVDYSKYLFENGIFVPAIRYPTVPSGQARLRISLTALHTRDDIDCLVNKLIEARERFG